MASAAAIVQKANKNLVSGNGGPILITVNRAKFPPYRMGYVKQRGSTAMKITENNFKSVKEQFLLDVQTAVENEDIPSN